MSAIDLVKEIAPAVARRRVRRGYVWLLQKTGAFYINLWLWNPRIYIPEPGRDWQREHVLPFVFSLGSSPNSLSRRVKNPVSGQRIRFDTVVAAFRLGPQFLVAHGFVPDEVITTAMLNFCWSEAVWEQSYHSEFAHLWEPATRTRTTCTVH